MNITIIIAITSVILSLKLSCTQATLFKCDTKFTELNGEADSEYCAEKPCVTKCCGTNEFIHGTRGMFKCKSIYDKYEENKTFLDIFTENNITYDISAFQFFEYVDENSVIASKKNFSDQFNLQQNGITLFYYNKTSDCYNRPKHKDSKNSNVYLLEDGRLTEKGMNSLYTAERQSFCVDVMIGFNKISNRFTTAHLVFQLLEIPSTTNAIFIVCALLISCFFIILVLMVYSVLPQLRKLGGMLLMAYLSTLLCGNLIKASTIIVNLRESLDADLCEVLSPVMYFFIMASFMWLNIMSFDMWWTFRAQFYQRAIHRKGELVKFLWYSLAVGSTAAAMTVTVVLIDKKSSLKIKPFLRSCFHNNVSDRIYLFGPMTFFTACNFMFFLMTVFNIWRIGKSITNINNASLNKNNKMFRSFMKISLLMGVSWILEMILGHVEHLPDWLFIIVNLYNGCIGAVFFLFFVCNKDTLTKFCRRFNIKNKFDDNKLDSSTRTTGSRPSTDKGSYSRARTTEDPLEINRIENTSPSNI